MEITILQLYKVSLSAGKAHRDHKHHHVHQFNHDGLVPTTAQPTLPPAVIFSLIYFNIVNYFIKLDNSFSGFFFLFR